MIDTDRKLRLEHMSAKEMVDANIAVSKDMFSLIYKNPCIRDLPKIASLYGFMGRLSLAIRTCSSPSD